MDNKYNQTRDLEEKRTPKSQVNTTKLI